MGERLETAYRDVMVIDPLAKPSARVRAAFVLSLISSHLARWAAGKNVESEIGCVVVYDQNHTRHACVFRPNEEMLKALEERLCERFGFDERMTHGKVSTLYGRALERAFPSLYPYVDPLVKPEDVARAKEQVEADRERRKEKAQKKAQDKQAKAKKDKKNAKPDGQERADAPRRRRKQG